MDNIRIGIAGFGKIGKVRAKVLSKMSGVDVVGVYDINESAAHNEGFDFYKSYDELLDLNLDAIFICAFNNVLAEFTAKALDKDIHVFCEKPPARSTKELLDVKKHIDVKPNLVLKYGFNHRYHYSVIEAKKIIDSGELGKLLWLRGVYGKAGSIDYDKNWRNYRKFSGGGILIDQGIHMLDLMRYFSGQYFDQINSFVTTAFWDIEAEDNAFAIMRAENGVLANLHSSATQWRHKFLLEMCFEEGYINLDGILSGTRSYAPEQLVVGRREFEDITYAMGKPQEKTVWFENDDSWQLEVEEFIGAVRGERKIENGTIKDAYETLDLVERIYKHSGFHEED